jgi:hypothetical protein
MKLINFKNIDDIKNYLRHANHAKRGALAEGLFAQIIKDRGLAIKSMHKEDADFFISNIGRIDVKSRQKLNVVKSKSINRVPKNLEISETIYSYFIFWDECVEVRSEKLRAIVPEISCTLSYSEILEYCQGKFFEEVLSLITKVQDSINNQKNDLKKWLLNNYNLNAKVIYRQGKKTQDEWNKRGWGPDNFHRSAKEIKKYDITVLMYFSGDKNYKVFAYPTSEFTKIKWDLKRIGSNLKKIYTFDPKILNSRYQFENEENFKHEAIARFIQLE